MLIAIAGQAQADQLVTITSNYVRSYVRLTTTNGTVTANDSFNGRSIPTSHSVDATTNSDPAFWSKQQIEYSGSNSGAMFTHEFDFMRDGGIYDYSVTYGDMYFTVSEDTTYDLSGALDVDDFSESNPGELSAHTFLHNTTTNTYLFEHSQQSSSTPDVSFTLGEQGDDTIDYTIDYLSGSLTGDLKVGNTYRWYHYNYTQAYPDADDGASAEGFAKLTVGDGGAVVPEPSTITLFAFGAFGFLGTRRRRK